MILWLWRLSLTYLEKWFVYVQCSTFVVREVRISKPLAKGHGRNNGRIELAQNKHEQITVKPV